MFLIILEGFYMKVYNSTQNNLIADNVKMAQTFVNRALGLILKSSLKEGEGLVIKPCCSIHTFFMKFAIDVIFVNKKNEVIALYKNVKPWRILPIHLASRYVIELPSGTITAKNITEHDIINIEQE